MSNKYLIDTNKVFRKEIENEMEFDKSDAKEVEVLDASKVLANYTNYNTPAQTFSDYLKANNYIILKIKE